LRFFLPLFVLAFLLAYFFRGPWWQRLLLVCMAVPVSIVMNSLRIASVGVLYRFLGARAAEGFFHDVSGWFVFMVSIALLLGAMWLMKMVFPQRNAREVPGEGEGPCVVRMHPAVITWSFPLAIPVLLLGSTLYASSHVDFREKVPLRVPFSAFPAEVAQWRGTRQMMEKVYLNELGLSDYLLVDFRDPFGNVIGLYTAYNETQRKGRSAHSPASCLPGAGWAFSETGPVAVPLPDGRRLLVNRALIEKNGRRQLAYYWFPQRGRILHNLFELKLYAFWDALTRHRTDGALVRVMAPLRPEEPLEEAEGRVQEFVRAVAPLLDRFIPGKEV
jgi:exosortase D (VPLPA-CTERM-specific)